jgi:hypothetical protein
VFRGEVPNGTWSLYAANSATGEAASIDAGWVMTIQTAPTLLLATNKVTTPEDTATNVNLTVGDFDDNVTNVTVTASSVPPGRDGRQQCNKCCRVPRR